MKTEINKLRTPIAIIGMAKSGESALRLLLESGIPRNHIITYDEKKPADVIKSEQLLDLAPQTAIVTPGFPLQSSLIQTLKKNGCQITSELNLAGSLLTSEKMIGITGSLGKSTTVSLLGQAIRCDDSNAFIGGNLGIPFCDYALGLLRGQARAKWIVLELSSYQLENCHELSFDCAGLTFLSANHLERYDSIQSYYLAKMNLFKQTKGPCFVNPRGGDNLNFLQQQKIPHTIVDEKTFIKENYPFEKATLIGQHNLDNLLLAFSMACHLGLSRAAQLKMLEYQGLPHRLELVTNQDGIRFINDSKATAIDSVSTAIHATLNISKNIFLLLGGRDKNLPWEDLQYLQDHHQIKVIYFGEARDLIKNKMNCDGPVFAQLGSAVNYCLENARTGDTVLLSPGGTSLDEFKNFEERGDFFKMKVRSHFENRQK